MIRFILKHRNIDTILGLNEHSYNTLDLDVPELEKLLTSGGSGPQGATFYGLEGVEIIKNKSEV